jgi:RimJ/RimL family protein N-acetyltransferase
LLEHCFTALDAHRIEAHIEPDNAASLRLAERLGFRREGLMRDQLFVDGKPRDALLYALLQPDWQVATSA